MIKRNDPKTIISEQYIYNPEPIKLTKENFFFAFSMQNSSKYNTLDETIFSPQMTIVKKKNSTITGVIPIPLRACNASDKPSNPVLIEYFRINPLQGMYCIDNYSQIAIEGTEDRWKQYCL